MPNADTIHDRFDPFASSRHDLKRPLTTIHARAQVLARHVRRSPTVADGDRALLLDGLAAIAADAREMAAHIDAVRCPSWDGGDALNRLPEVAAS